MQSSYYPTTSVAGHVDTRQSVRSGLLRKSPDQVRSTTFQVGVVHHAAGSAYAEVGRTQVLATVHGPHTDTRNRHEYSDQGKLECDVKFAPFAQTGERRDRGQAPDELELSSVLTQALTPAILLHKLPKCVVSVHVLVLSDDGGVLSTAVNSASLALAHAGIDMVDLVTSATAGVYQGTVELDPATATTEQGTLTIALLPRQNKTSYMMEAGRMDHVELQEATDLVSDACAHVLYPLQRASLV